MVNDGVVVDANVISNYIQESIQESGDIFQLIEKILVSSYGLAISDKIEREWKNTTGNLYFDTWFAEQLKNGRIHYIEKPELNDAIRKRIHNIYGLPRRGHDIEYIKTANKTIKKYILTNDIDFYDPKKKQSSVVEKEKIKNQRCGDLCRYLRKELDIIVGLPRHCCNDLFGYNFS
jgi:rRNA-processing protein FCF1